MSNHLAISISSRVLLQLSANPFCCGVSDMVFSCIMPASKQYILNCSEKNSFALSCLNFLGVPTQRTKFFRLASASLFALSKSTNTNFEYWSANTMQNRTLTVTLLWRVPSRLWTPSLASLLIGSLPLLVFVILAKAHTLHTSSSSPTVFGAFLTTSVWFKWPNCLCNFLALSSFTLLELILKYRTLQGKKKQTIFLR